MDFKADRPRKRDGIRAWIEWRRNHPKEVQEARARRAEANREYRLLHPLVVRSEYRIWSGLKQRCLNPNSPAYKYYGGRGITVHPNWVASFKAFLDDVGPRPSDLHSIDRFPDKNGNYEPGNVRWATMLEQAQNRNANKGWSAEARIRNRKISRELVASKRSSGLTFAKIGAELGISRQRAYQIWEQTTHA